MPPTATPNRFGVLAGDTQGFPNGRRLADDVTDIELRVIAGALLAPEAGGKQIPLGDGVDRNEKPFRTSFPYVALPDSGFDAKFGRIEPAHAPVPQPPAPDVQGAGCHHRPRVRHRPRRPQLTGAARPRPRAVARPVLTGTSADIPKLQSAVTQSPNDEELRAALAAAYLQRVRETGDPSYYTRAEGVLRDAQDARRARHRRRAGPRPT